jgi:hypothetical protein
LYVDAEFERILDPNVDAPLAHAELEERLPAYHWSPQASGTEIPPDVAGDLEAAWGHHVGAVLGASPTDADVSAYEGQLRLLIVRHRRREQRVRIAKIEATLAAKGRLVCEVLRGNSLRSPLASTRRPSATADGPEGQSECMEGPRPLTLLRRLLERCTRSPRKPCRQSNSRSSHRSRRHHTGVRNTEGYSTSHTRRSVATGIRRTSPHIRRCHMPCPSSSERTPGRRFRSWYTNHRRGSAKPVPNIFRRNRRGHHR